MGVAAADACVDSLGGALSILSAYELAHKHPTRKVTLVTFGSPRAVNKPMADELKRLPNMLAYRVVNNTDAVTRVPPTYFGFRHVGHTIWLRDGSVGRPEKFGRQPVRLMTMPWSAFFLDPFDTVKSHSMALYNEALLGYSWSTYESAQKRSTVRAREAHLPAPMRSVKHLGRGVRAVLTMKPRAPPRPWPPPPPAHQMRTKSETDLAV